MLTAGKEPRDRTRKQFTGGSETYSPRCWTKIIDQKSQIFFWEVVFGKSGLNRN
jgi:hypothetical protein